MKSALDGISVSPVLELADEPVVVPLSLKGQWDSVGQGVTLRPRQYFSIFFMR